MIIYTRYKFNGEVLFSRFINFEEIMDRKYSCLGQMTRVTIKGGKTYEGFADEPYLSNKGKCLTLIWYDIDYDTLGLRSGKVTTIFIPLDIIIGIESILHSNPRWGHPPINEFVFSSELRSRLMKLHEKYMQSEEKKVGQKRYI